MSAPRFTSIVIDSDETGRNEMADILAHNGVHVLAILASIDELTKRLQGSEAPALIIVRLDPSPAQALSSVSSLVKQHPRTAFFVSSEAFEAELVLESMRAGVRQFVPLPLDKSKFLAGLERLAQDLGVAARGRIIQIIPTTGGCGATTIACNVAAALAQTGRTALIDMDLIYGGVANAFDLTPRYTIADLMEASPDLDQAVLENALVVHRPSGVAVLARPETPEDAQRVNFRGFYRLLDMLAEIFDYVVIDSRMSADELHTRLGSASDLIVLVSELNVPSVKNAQRFMRALARMGVSSESIKIVVNRHVKKADVTPAEMESTLGTKIAWTIPNDFASTMSAINFGQPLVAHNPRAAISQSIRGLAHALNGRKPNLQPNRR